jgi:hypothetical protein
MMGRFVEWSVGVTLIFLGMNKVLVHIRLANAKGNTRKQQGSQPSELQEMRNKEESDRNVTHISALLKVYFNNVCSNYDI